MSALRIPKKTSLNLLDKSSPTTVMQKLHIGDMITDDRGTEIEVQRGVSNIPVKQFNGSLDINCRRLRDYKGSTLCKEVHLR